MKYTMLIILVICVATLSLYGSKFTRTIDGKTYSAGSVSELDRITDSLLSNDIDDIVTYYNLYKKIERLEARIDTLEKKIKVLEKAVEYEVFDREKQIDYYDEFDLIWEEIFKLKYNKK